MDIRLHTQLKVQQNELRYLGLHLSSAFFRICLLVTDPWVKYLSAIFAQVLKAFQNSRFYQWWILSDCMKPDFGSFRADQSR
jgi:hypothetical protein